MNKLRVKQRFLEQQKFLEPFSRRVALALAIVVLAIAVSSARIATAQSYLWDGFAENPQHTSLSSVASQSLLDVRWQDQVDLDPQYSYGGVLYAHYGSPMITAGNTVLAPIKTTASGGFEVQGLNSATGGALWTLTSDYVVPPTGAWTPPYSPTLNSSGALYYAGADGTVFQANINSAAAVAPTRLAFYGTSTYAADPSAFSNVYIDTPITTDSAGDIYFGYMVSGTPAIAAMGTGGIARISASGVGTYVSAATASGNSSMVKAVENCAPAISSDGSSIYVAVNSSNFSSGYLLQLNSTTLATQSKVVPIDPQTGNPALLTDDGTASPTIGPDGDVYLGVYDDNYTSRGWTVHYSANLATTKTPGGFGWDDTVTIVPASMVPSYHGTSSYLLMTKYNNYLQTGGGQNMIAILDPNAPVTDNQRNNGTGATIMQVVESILGPTANPNGGVYEWCDNNAVVDPATDSILVTSEDGHLYRWNLATNTLTQSVSLGGGLGEAYTPTIIGPDGTVYALNNGVLNSVGLPVTGWTGSAGSAWNTTAANWITGSPTPGSTYSDGAVLLFGNTTGSTAITIQPGGVKPAWMTFTNTGAANGGVDYTIGGGPIAGGTGITLDGTGGIGGAVFLTGANSFTGGVSVNFGRLNLQNGLALGNSSGATVSYGAALELQNNTTNPMTFGLTAGSSSPIPLTLAGNGLSGAGALNNVAGNNTWAGPISIGINSGGATIASTASGDQLTLSGGIGVAPGNTLAFAGAGKSTISGGALSLAVGTAGSYAGLAMQGSGILEIDAAPTLGDYSVVQANSGILRFNVGGGAATIGAGVVATVASGATLQLAGSVSALSGGGLVNIVNNGSTASGGGLLVTGTNQSVGSVTGAATTSGVTTYGGDTVVGPGANLTATQVLQNTLTIGAGATVTILPSVVASPGPAASAAESASIAAIAAPPASDDNGADTSTSTGESSGESNSDLLTAIQAAIGSGAIGSPTGQRLENRIAAIERLAASDSGFDMSLFENAVAASLASDISLFGSSSLPTSATPDFDSEGAVGAAAVPEPSTLLLAAAAGLGLAMTRRAAFNISRRAPIL